MDEVIGAAHAQQRSKAAAGAGDSGGASLRRKPSLGTALLGFTFGSAAATSAGARGKRAAAGAGAGPGVPHTEPPRDAGGRGGSSSSSSGAPGSGERVNARLSHVAELCCALAARVTPPNAPSLLDLSLKVMALLPSAQRNTIYSDGTLAQVVACVPRATLLDAASAVPGAVHGGEGRNKQAATVPDVRMAPQVLLEARRAGGVLTRTALAAAVPLLFLAVRVSPLARVAVDGTCDRG